MIYLWLLDSHCFRVRISACMSTKKCSYSEVWPAAFRWKTSLSPRCFGAIPCWISALHASWHWDPPIERSTSKLIRGFGLPGTNCRQFRTFFFHGHPIGIARILHLRRTMHDAWWDTPALILRILWCIGLAQQNAMMECINLRRCNFYIENVHHALHHVRP